MSPLYKVEPDPVPAAPTPRRKPGELGLDVSASVLRLPYTLGARMVLAEIISLHRASTRGCDASDQHFADRLGITSNTAGAAVKLLFDAKLISKTVDKALGYYRVLAPRFEAIEAAAKLNPYPVHQGRTTPKIGLGTTPKIGVVPPTQEIGVEGTTQEIGVGYPENWGSTTQEIGVGLPQKLGTNTSSNLSPNSSIIPHAESLPSAALIASEGQKKIEGERSENQQLTGLQGDITRSLPTPKVADAELVTTAKSTAPAKKRAAGRAAAPARQQAEPLPDCCPLAELLNEGGDAARVQLLAEPLTEKQAYTLLNEFSEPVLRDIFCQMANWGKLLTPSGATSANLTARNWLKKRADAKKTESDATAHHHQRGPQYRSTNGAKPSADAGSYARALAEQDGD